MKWPSCANSIQQRWRSPRWSTGSPRCASTKRSPNTICIGHGHWHAKANSARWVPASHLPPFHTPERTRSSFGSYLSSVPRSCRVHVHYLTVCTLPSAQGEPRLASPPQMGTSFQSNHIHRNDHHLMRTSFNKCHLHYSPPYLHVTVYLTNYIFKWAINYGSVIPMRAFNIVWTILKAIILLVTWLPVGSLFSFQL